MARISAWKPEDEQFWATEGKRHARRNLLMSTPNLMIAFIVWQIWSVVAVRLNDVGFAFTQDQLFTLAAIPGLVGATLRFAYTFAVGIVGGRNWTVISTLVLLIPAVGIGMAVQNPDTPFSVMLLLAALCGLGGGNFCSSSANISFFFPKKEKGTALGINGGLGNMGVSVVQFVTPIILTSAAFVPLFGEGHPLKNGTEIWLQNAAFVWIVPIILLAIAAFFGMDNLPEAKQSVSQQFSVFKLKHNWIMTVLYVGTFGSFIGYSAAFPLLLKSQFPEHVSLAFWGAFLAAAARPIGGWISDKFGGARITSIVLVVMTLGAAAAIYFINIKSFAGFLPSFLILFIAAGLGSGSTFQMIPFIFPQKAAASVLGMTAAFAAYGSFFIPKLFGWSTTAYGTPVNALYYFIGFYVVCIVLNWYYYERKGAEFTSFTLERTPKPAPAPTPTTKSRLV
ncbi:MFS transporter [Paenibacillus chartarius]|uniref:MFS transporter n=1 Tax=Paenibacillus chartarius TaxID=747481 RepID=A0ABV6DHR9_9BACL